MDCAKKLMAKFKNLRKILRCWYAQISNLATTIQNNKMVLNILDTIKEYRDLSLEEWNFRAMVQDNLNGLLEQERIYWKQRGRIKWVTLGDENTKFFHANTTVRHSKNCIRSLPDADGVVRIQHDEKALLLWESFKDRLGQSEYAHMHFDLETLLTPIDDLDSLVIPFSNEEIDGVVKNMKIDKSPGPDGFNTDFLKKCWNDIKSDFYDLCLGFYDLDICLQSINVSFITLIPKIDNPSRVGDFRPISLLNNSIKLLTKLLANRLQIVILRYVHQNQYGFIKGRSIKDCLAWSFKYLHLCHKSKKELVILKLDFEKAFDKVDHEVISLVLQHKGFPQKWLKWIRDILASGTSSVLLNGVPDKVFHCRRGVRQGDPLSTLLFVLVADLLQTLINKVKELGLLRLPIQVG
jgi:hypothetical protein